MIEYHKIKDTNYSISKCGRVRNDKFDRELKPFDNGNGYLAVDLFTNGKSRVVGLHRLLMETFTDNPDKLPQINHIDGNPKNNKLTNLEWCSASDNHRHRYHILKSSPKRCEVTGRFTKREFPK